MLGPALEVSSQQANLLYSVSNAVKNGASVIINKVSEVAKYILNIFKEVSSSRYLGSKTWSIPGFILSIPVRLFNKIFKGQSFFKDTYGYHFYASQRLTVNETRGYLKYAAAAAAVHRNDSKWIDGLNLKIHSFSPEDAVNFTNVPGQLSVREKCLFDPKTSLKIGLIESDQELLICFGAKESGHDELSNDAERRALASYQQWTATKNILGFKLELYDQAVHAVEAILAANYAKGRSITLVGQSFGGAFASYVGIQKQLSAVCFNSVPLGAGLQSQIGDKKLSEAEKYITQISIERDYLTDSRTGLVFDLLLSSIGIRTPGNFGRRYKIPSAYTDFLSIHSYVLGSVMKYLGYDIRSTAGEVVRAESLATSNK